MKIVLTGGGTGGHLFPLIAVAKELEKELGQDVEFLYLGTGEKLEKLTMDAAGIKTKHILAGKKRRYFSFKNFIDVFKIPLGFIQSLWILLWYMPDVIFAKGGYAPVPVVIAGWFYRIPILIHESDAVPGMANKILSKFSDRVAVSYPGAERYFPQSKTALTGNPIRQEIKEGDANNLRKRFGFTESKPIIFVIGGSQGSKAINEAILRILIKLILRAQVVHQTGEKNYEEVVRQAGEAGIKAGREGYVPLRFLDIDLIKDAYAAADLVISRAGANTISEIAACGKAAILIPLSGAASNHQAMNANELARIGGALVLEEENLGENLLLQKIEKILDDEEFRRSMEEKIMAFYHPDAGEKIARGIIELAS
jgi:UDP-N-acetylglucosamine--N-acetylmuramyl-(pentapeptide) pyrophosphoryl-undecaprenol N-acetylglucosamine transferase